ncbi:hypothetical protein B5S28_g3296 [[Candida] boidinii]|nr:hypothetical protein B5S28_g3296 [[Candida] boidinii]OWB60829.1 hypothetical protein B5S29_g1712 [[Candida] boidinii]OWB73585.1 hypothetical protein B5S31_g3334 [[Candida] boidinii]OWB76686.1 hypothetical protein B5S32_g841 [[Candida] boidinii]GME96402.1 unnamed protein product [[Candida] boidinii]
MNIERDSTTDLSSELDPETINHPVPQPVEDNLNNKTFQSTKNDPIQVPIKEEDFEDEEEYEHELITESNRLLLQSSKLELESIELRSRANAIENMFETSIKQITSSLKALEQNSEKLDSKKFTKDPETEDNKGKSYRKQLNFLFF